MRQNDTTFSTILTKIGDGNELDIEERKLIESRFRTREWCDKHGKSAIRLFHKNEDVNDFHRNNVSAQWHSIACDTYNGYRGQDQLVSARTKVHKMTMSKTGNLLYNLPLSVHQPYMITCNIDIDDGMVNGAIGFLRYVDFKEARDSENDSNDEVKSNSPTSEPYCLWIEFKDDARIGKMARTKCKPLLITRRELK